MTDEPDIHERIGKEYIPPPTYVGMDSTPDEPDIFERCGVDFDECAAVPEPSNTVRSKTRDMINRMSQKGKMWAVANDRDYFACDAAVDQMPPGQYIIHHCETRGFYFHKKTINLDALIELPDDNSEKVLDVIKKFWKQKHLFKEMGFLWKRGVMLWGPPGSGKTSCLQRLSKLFIDQGGIAIYCSRPGSDAMGLMTLRSIEPDRPILVMLEDIDSIIKKDGEADLLALLDGELQIDNVVFVATTNYPELLDPRLINRPSRFDQIFHIGMPNASCRETYLATKNPRLAGTDELAGWVTETKDFSIAHMKELIIAVECLEQPFEEAVTRLKKMKHTPSSTDGNGQFGFTNG